MSLPTNITDPRTHSTAKVTTRGQVVTAPLEFSSAHNAAITVADTAYNLVLPTANKKFVVTDIILNGDKTVSNVVDAVVSVYEASSSDTLTVDAVILSTTVARSGQLVLTGMNLITEGTAKWINVKSSDVNIVVNLYGYYVEA